MRRLLPVSCGFFAAALLVCYLLPEGGAKLFSAISLALTLGLALLRMREPVPARKAALTGAVLAASGLLLGFVWIAGWSFIVLRPALTIIGDCPELTAVVCDYPRQGEYGAVVEARVSVPDSPLKARARVYLGDEGMTLKPGDVVMTAARIGSADNIGGQETDYFSSRGVILLAYGRGEMRVVRADGLSPRYYPAAALYAVREKIAQIFPESAAGFMTALLTGDGSGLSDSLDRFLALAGLKHVVVVSGMHFSLMISMILTLCGGRRRIASFISLPLVLLFMAMLPTPSVLRAGIMQLFIIASGLLRREGDPLTALGAALLLILLKNPYAAAHVGLQLSFAATLGILLFSQRLGARLLAGRTMTRVKARAPKRLYGAAAALCLLCSSSLSAMAFTVPLTALHFGYVSIVAPLTNILTLWAVSLCFTLGAATVLLGFVFPALTAVLALAPALLARYVCAAAELLGALPFAAVYTKNQFITPWICCCYLMAFMTLRSEEKRAAVPIGAAACALCAALVFGRLSYDAEEFSLTALDVGQGQCIIASAAGETVVIDCGGSAYSPGDAAADHILARGDDSIELLVLTHYHEDHAGGAAQLIARMDVEAVAIPDIPDEGGLRSEIEAAARERGAELLVISEDMSASLGGLEVEVYAPVSARDANESSLSVMTDCGGYRALVTGDMDRNSERRLYQMKELPDIDLLIAGHHGSAESSDPEFLEAVLPETVIISVAEGNSYGHPSPETMANLSAVGADIYTTADCGEITVGRR